MVWHYTLRRFPSLSSNNIIFNYFLNVEFEFTRGAGSPNAAVASILAKSST